MTILWIYNLPLKPEAGGTERITSLVAKGLSQRGYHCMDILVFHEQDGSMQYQGKPVDNLYAFLKENKVDVVINQIAYSTWLLNMFLAKGGAQWQQEGGKIISCLHFDPKNPSLLHLISCKRHKTWRDRLQQLKLMLLQPVYTRKRQKEEGRIYNYIYEHSDRMVALSARHFPYMHRVMRRAEYSRLAAINNPLTFDDIASPDILDEKKKVVLVCARMSEYHKRISLTLKAWVRLQEQCPIASEWTLKLVGEGSDLEGYKEYVRTRHIPNIRFEGQQSPEPYYHEAGMLLVTSSAEGWGLNITEGLQRGVVPVVMDNCPVFADMVEQGVNGYIVRDGSIGQFAATLAGLMKDTAQRRRMQQAALESAKRFGMAQTMDKWEELIG